MKKYFLHNGIEQQGPFDIDDLRKKRINRNTPIWYEDLSNWTTADKIEELSSLFAQSSPPPFVQGNNIQTSAYPMFQKRKSSTGKAVLITIIVLAVIIAGLSFLKMRNSRDYPSYQPRPMTVEEIERTKPINFLSASGKYIENFWGDKFIIQGTVKNSATIATYKDVVVRVTYLTKTQTAIGSNDYTIYDAFLPHSSKNFELKVGKHKNVDASGLDVIRATNY